MASWAAAGACAAKTIGFVLFAFAGGASAQAQKDEPGATVEKWLAGDQNSRDQLDATVKALLAEPAAGIAWLARELPDARKAPAEPRSKGVLSLCSHTILEFCRRQRATNITFDGQYSPLAPLQPYVCDLLFSLLLETPDWFPHSHRVQLVRPLRDLQPQAPPAERLDAVIRLVENTEIEPEDLRHSLAGLLWQWDKKEHAQAIVKTLMRASSEGDAEDRVHATLELASYLTYLRELKQAANAHRSAQALAKSANVTLKPLAWYNAACVHALLGDVEHGIAALATCAEVQNSPRTDPSLRLPRTMFDADPEIALLRRDPRFAKIVEQLFAVAPKPATEPATEPGGR